MATGASTTFHPGQLVVVPSGSVCRVATHLPSQRLVRMVGPAEGAAGASYNEWDVRTLAKALYHHHYVLARIAEALGDAHTFDGVAHAVIDLAMRAEDNDLARTDPTPETQEEVTRKLGPSVGEQYAAAARMRYGGLL